MADVVTTRTLFQGERKLITSYVNVSDGSGGTTKIVDASALTKNSKNEAVDNVSLNRIWFNVSAATTAPVQLQWDLSSGTQTPLLALNETDNYDFSDIGGLPNYSGSGKTGDVQLTTVGHASGETYAITITCVKEY